MKRDELGRREFLRIASAATAGVLLPGAASSAIARIPPATGPKIVILRFGGGVRRSETIAPAGARFTPLLHDEILPEGTLWSDVWLEGHPTHSTGTINITTGRYDFHMDLIERDELVPAAPTLFELARKQLGLAMHETLVVNNGNSTEWVGYSDDPDFGAAHRPGVLSVEALARYTLAHPLPENSEPERPWAPATWRPDRHRGPGYRGLDHSWDERMLAFFERHRARLWHGQHRGDDETLAELAVAALADLRPRLMMVNLQDVDYVHWGVPRFYWTGLERTDLYTHRIFEAIRSDPYYRDDTYFFVMPDCGRDDARVRYLPYQHHAMYDGHSHEIFLYAWGPGVPRGKRVDRRAQQVDLAPTIGSLLGLRGERWQGEALSELQG